MDYFKNFLPTIIGCVAGIIIIYSLEVALSHVFQFGTSVADPSDKKALAAAISKMPVSAFLALLGTYCVASLGSGIVSTLMVKGRSYRPAIAAGVVLTISGLINVVSIPHPTWFVICNLFCYIPFSFLGYSVARALKNRTITK
jgi:hypothetical protein